MCLSIPKWSRAVACGPLTAGPRFIRALNTQRSGRGNYDEWFAESALGLIPEGRFEGS